MAADERARRVPVVIVGAGPAGLVTAITLARGGVGSLLVERNPGLSPLPRATAVSARTLELLRSWGLEDDVRAGQLDVSSMGAFATETLASPEGAVLPVGVATFKQAAAVSPTSGRWSTPSSRRRDVSTLMLGVLLRSMERDAPARTPRGRRGGPPGRARRPHRPGLR